MITWHATKVAAAVGAVAFTWLDEFLIDYRELRLMIYGFVIIALFLGFRRGVVPTVTAWFRRRPSSRPATAISAPTPREESVTEPA